MNILWIGLGLIGALIIYLILNGENATTFGLSNSNFASVALMSMWGALIASAVIPRRGQWKEFARNAALWILIILVLVAGYVLRYDLQDIASRMTAGLIPGSPRTVQSNDGRDRVVLTKGEGNHFIARTVVNDQTIVMLVDTGATTIVLSERDAIAAGIDVANLSYNVLTNTANGTAFSARTRINSIELGNITRRNMTVLVSKPEALNESLLGMNFLSSLSSFEFRGDELYLTD